MTSLAQSERAALADLLLERGPDSPTLCEGWTTRDLAAHLVIRERRPDAAIGLVVAPLAPRTERVQKSYAKRPYGELVQLVRSGPPRLSFFAVPGADAAANTLEMFVHHEDVRRALESWAPRDLTASVQDVIWGRLKGMAKMSMRSAPCGVVLVRTTGERKVAKSGTPAVTVIGEPGEIAMFAFGRKSHAKVELSGDESCVSKLRDTAFGV